MANITDSELAFLEAPRNDADAIRAALVAWNEAEGSVPARAVNIAVRLFDTMDDVPDDLFDGLTVRKTGDGI